MAEILCLTIAFLAISLAFGNVLFGSRVANPMFCFFLIWTADFALLTLDRYIGIFFLHVTPGSERMFMLNFAALGAGMILMAVALAPRNGQRAFSSACISRLWSCNRLLIAIYALGVLAKYGVLVSRFGAVGFLASSRLLIGRGEFDFPAICKLLTLPGYLLSLNLGVIAARERRWTPWAVFAVVEAAAAINDMPTGYRGESMSFPLYLSASWALTTAASGRAIKLRHLAVGGLAALTLVFALLTVHLAAYWSRATTEDNPYLSGLQAPIVYNYIDLVGTIPAAAYYLDSPYKPPDSNAGPAFFSFRALYTLTNLLAAPLGYPVIPKVVDMPIAVTNPISGYTFTAVCYLTLAQTDFGDWGAPIFSFLMGLITVFAVRLALDSTRLLHIETAACMLAMLLACWRDFYPSDPHFWVTLALTWCQSKYMALT